MTRVTIYYTPSVAGFPGTSSITIEVSVSFTEVLCNISLFDMLPKKVTSLFELLCPKFVHFLIRNNTLILIESFHC